MAYIFYRKGILFFSAEENLPKSNKVYNYSHKYNY